MIGLIAVIIFIGLMLIAGRHYWPAVLKNFNRTSKNVVLEPPEYTVSEEPTIGEYKTRIDRHFDFMAISKRVHIIRNRLSPEESLILCRKAFCEIYEEQMAIAVENEDDEYIAMLENRKREWKGN